eukprot:12567034-Ditylum_brightwellii.AAC.1
MGLCNSPDIFQEKMSTFFADIEEIRAYIDDLLMITNGDWESHPEKLDEVLDRLKCAGLKGIKPQQKKVEAVLKIVPPLTRKQLHSFIGMISYYCDMWQGCSEVLSPLVMLTSKATPWK